MKQKFIGLLACTILIGSIFTGCTKQEQVTTKTKPEPKIIEKAVTIDYNATPEQILLSYTEEGMAEFKRNFPEKPIMDFALKSIGKQAPDFELKNLKGDTIKLSNLKGKKILLDIVKVDCPECVKATPVINKITSQLKDIMVIPVFPKNTKSEVEEFYKSLKMDINTSSIAGKDNLKKMTMIKDYNLSQVPTLIFIDETGKISYVRIGYSDEVAFKDYINTAFRSNKLYNNIRKDKIEVDKNDNPIVTNESKDKNKPETKTNNTKENKK